MHVPKRTMLQGPGNNLPAKKVHYNNNILRHRIELAYVRSTRAKGEGDSQTLRYLNTCTQKNHVTGSWEQI